MAKQDPLPDWELLLRAAAALQGILPDATLVGGSAAAIDAGHRRSIDADHVIAGLTDRFDDVLAQLESAAGWQTSRVKRPVMIMGSLDGILTTVRNQIRSAPLETRTVDVGGQSLRVPSSAEILRIKAWLIVRRNATRDFLDVAAVSDRLGVARSAAALADLDRLYPQPNDHGAVRLQLMAQLSQPRPYDLDDVRPNLREYKSIAVRWQSWEAVVEKCAALAVEMGIAVANRRTGYANLRED
jgi:hypothetical protein